MIRSYFGLTSTPFCLEHVELLPHQQEIYDTLMVHSRQGGLCLLLGDPGTGKSVIKEALKQQQDKRLVVVTVARTLHTYGNTIKILCQAFSIETDEGSYFKIEKRLIEEAYSLHRQGKMLVTIIDDAHFLEMDTLRRLRLLFEDFPKSHNVILIGQPALLHQMSLKVNEDIKSRVTYSIIMPKLVAVDMQSFILAELDRVTLAHNTFDTDSLSLVIRSSEGILRRARNLTLGCLLEAVRSQKKHVDLAMVNRVLIHPHWRIDQEVELVRS